MIGLWGRWPIWGMRSRIKRSETFCNATVCALEGKLLQIVHLADLGGQSSHRHVVFGQVIGIHIDDRFIKNGRLDTAAIQPIARCGYADYAVVDKVFSIPREGADRGGVRNVVGIGAARLRKHQNIDSSGKVNWLIDELGCQRLPTIDLAHAGLS